MRCTYSSLREKIDKLRDTFWSRSIRREGQAPLTVAENEVNKIGKALNNIFCPNTIDSIDRNDQYYQNVFNAGHYILYLITRDYISKERRPPVAKGIENNRQSLLELQNTSEQSDQKARDMLVVIKEAAQQLLDEFSVTKTVHKMLVVVESVFEKDTHKVFKLIGTLLGLPGASPVGFVRALSLALAEGPGIDHKELESIMTTKEEKATLDGIVLATAFYFIESGVTELCDMLQLTERENVHSVARLYALRQQHLSAESGVGFVTLLFGIVNGMVREAKQDKFTNAASVEEVDALTDSVNLWFNPNHGGQRGCCGCLKLLKTPMKCIPALDAYSITISLGYDPETTTENDIYWFQKAAKAIQIFRSRRGTAIAQDFLQCLQVIVQQHSSAETLERIASSVVSNLSPFSKSDASSYQQVANLESSEKVISYLTTSRIRRELMEGKVPFLD
ncbi:hypothetical protein BWQ96_08057 [Gracilariopsis chorda]|uniref:Uncharacterized protein n=1 Tax=Gracilariopsis chorda TaxID=448386 RepID=A0A2V3IJJ6_9FLOR|nr:hypothetical protein BWQ96_08057 [Gracilariopsis chorda]|eukprot:PXF42229.1 hypothetical protein BWQ96_08057 [Gracilariopsis chorda]